MKTPLTFIRLFAEMLRDGRTADPARQRHYLDIMVSETERLTRLINNVLDFGRSSRGQRQYAMRLIDLNNVVGDVFESQRVRLEHAGFTVACRSAGEPLACRADAEAIKQVLINLLSNAEKYSSNEKWIEVTVAPEG